jgi:hypothetical protein
MVTPSPRAPLGAALHLPVPGSDGVPRSAGAEAHAPRDHPRHRRLLDYRLVSLPALETSGGTWTPPSTPARLPLTFPLDMGVTAAYDRRSGGLL